MKAYVVTVTERHTYPFEWSEGKEYRRESANRNMNAVKYVHFDLLSRLEGNHGASRIDDMHQLRGGNGAPRQMQTGRDGGSPERTLKEGSQMPLSAWTPSRKTVAGEPENESRGDRDVE